MVPTLLYVVTIHERLCCMVKDITNLLTQEHRLAILGQLIMDWVYRCILLIL